MKKILRHWKIIYAACCLVYMGWVIHVGVNEFGRINGQYRNLEEQLAADRVKTAALEELVAECRNASRGITDPVEDACLTQSPQSLAARAKAIKEQRTRARQRGAMKLVLFYMGFVVIFLLVPPILIYLLLVGVIALYKNIKIIR